MLQSFDPATGEVVWEGPAATPATVIHAVDAARRALAGWALAPLAERLAAVRAYRSVIESRSDDLSRLISRETGKPLWEGRGEVASMRTCPGSMRTDWISVGKPILVSRRLEGSSTSRRRITGTR